MSRQTEGIWLDGERELFVNMQRRMDNALVEARKGLQKAGLQIIADAKQSLRGNHSVVTGQLRASGKAQQAEGDESALDVGFFSQNTRGGYAFFVEYGRRSGRMPPPDMLIQWCRKKLRMAEDAARRAGWAMALKSARKGTRPHPFFGPAVEKNNKAVSDAIAEAVRKETEKNG